jgi:hypothetical protein
MKKITEILSMAGIIILLIFLAGCTSSDTPAQNTNSNVGVMEVGPTPTPTPVPHTIIGTWNVNYNGHSGSIKFDPSGYVDINISGYPGASIQYIDDGNNSYSASYYTYSAVFKYNPDSDTVTSEQYPGIKLMRVA